MTDPRQQAGPQGGIQPGLHPPQQRPSANPGLHPQPSHHPTPGLHPQHSPTHGQPIHNVPPGGGLHSPQRVQPVGAPAARPAPVLQPEGDDPIALVEELMEEEVSPAAAPKKIKAFGEEGAKKQHEWKRKPLANGQGACRMRSFHGKYSDQGLQYLDDAINEWLDAHPEVEVKFVTSTVGVFEGKIREPALVLNLWY